MEGLTTKLLHCKKGGQHYVPRYLCSPVPMFPEPMFPGTYVPRSYVPRYLCSPIYCKCVVGHIYVGLVIGIGIDSIHGQRNPHRERGLVGMGNGCFAEFCCCVPLCPCELRYSSSKDISFHRFPGDKVAGRECIFKSRRDMPLL